MNRVLALWKQILFFGSYLGYLLWISPLSFTHIAGGDKTFGHVEAAEFLSKAFFNPSYLFSGWIVTRLPIDPAMSMTIFLSIIPAVLTAILVFNIISMRTNSRYAPWIGSLILMSSWTFSVQAIKIEAYVFVSFLLLLGYWLYLKGKFSSSSGIFAISAIGHSGVALPVIAAVFLYLKDFRRRWYIFVGIILFAAIVWMFVPTLEWRKDSAAWPYLVMAVDELLSHGSFSSAFSGWFRMGMLFFVSFGLGTIPAILYLRKNWKESLVFPLFFSVFCFIAMTALPSSGWRGLWLLCMASPFLAILAGFGFEKLNMNISKILLVFCSLILLVLFPISLGGVDETLSSKYLLEYLEDLPENSYIVDRVAFYADDGKIYNFSISPLFSYFFRTNNPDWELRILDISHEADFIVVMDGIAEMIDGELYYFEMIEGRNWKCELRLWN